MGDEYGLIAAEGIKKVIDGSERVFYCEYPCHSDSEQRWFMMRVTPFSVGTLEYYVISHQNITERKLVEIEVLNLSRIDGLTSIYNRRYFDSFLRDEWKRCARLTCPITLAIFDIDHFKLLNDCYGYQAGDDCLNKIGAVLKVFAQRPGDICARYGGEEFVVALGNTSLSDALPVIESINAAIRNLNIPNKESPTAVMVTASVGVATLYPKAGQTEADLISAADALLYQAKEQGRNRVIGHQISGFKLNNS